MLRSWMVPAAGLALAGSLTGPATAAELYASLPIATSPVLARQAAEAKAASLKRAESGRPAPTRPGMLRRRDPETTSALPAPPPRSSCPPARRVGTGAGFCLVN